MWSASIRERKIENGEAVVIVDYRDDSGQPTITEVLRPSSVDAVNQQIQSTLDRMNAGFDIVSAIKPGPFSPPDPVALPTPVVNVPNPQDIAREQFISDYQLLQAMQRAISAGLKKVSDQDYLDLTAKVKSEFLPEYVTLI